jgi:hypothetical protein
MITFHELGSLGRLGNQLFQYAALRSLSLSNDYEIKIPHPASKYWHGQECLLGSLSLEADFLVEEDLKKVEYHYSEPDPMQIDPLFFEMPDNTNISGFFQSTFYFKNHSAQIKKELTPNRELLEGATDKVLRLKAENPGHEIISLHLRRGDNTDWSNPSSALSLVYGNDGTLQPHSFYSQYLEKAKAVFKGRKCKFLVFSGGSRKPGNSNMSDLEWCRSNFIGDEYLFSDDGSTLGDFSLIMNCDHNIISHISSFGWWAAYLNSNKSAEIVAPIHYHPDMPQYTHRELFYPETWRLV